MWDDGSALTGEDRPQGLTLHRARHLDAGCFEERGRDVDQLDQGIADTGLHDFARPREYEWNAHRAVEEARSLKDEPVIAKNLAVIAVEDNQRIVQARPSRQGRR